MKKSSLLIPLSLCAATAMAKTEQPNVIIIMTDDQGYQDLGCYGSPKIKTPRVDKLATEGIKFTDFYQSSSVSSASRAGILTGKLNCNNGVKSVYFPIDVGMRSDEVTIAEELKKLGYKTACFGKWHLGDIKGHLPLDQGFDEYFGIPYSNDMYITPTIPLADNIVFREGYDLEKTNRDIMLACDKPLAKGVKGKLAPKSPLVDGERIVEYPCDQSTLTRRYFDRAISFIKNRGDAPFFTYITPTMPHIPLFASEQFKGTSERGLYGDCVEEIDWNVGRLLDLLDSEGLSENTIVIYLSDNGPWLQMKEHSGSADPLRDGKFTLYDGGVRVPCVMRFPGRFPAGVTATALTASIDLFPTILHYAGSDTIEHQIDGFNIAPYLENPKKPMRDEYLYVKFGHIIGIRKGDWIYLPKSGEYNTNENSQPELFNIKKDISQSENLYTKEPKQAAKMEALLQLRREEMVRK